MKTRFASVVFTAGIAAGLTLGFAAQASPVHHDGTPSEDSTASQARIADTTLKLEKAFSEQFVRGTIDREALSGPIAEVVQAMPEATRPKVQSHIDQVIEGGQKLAAQMTPEERTQLATTPTAEKIGTTQQRWATAWGWPTYAGWGGYGAFGFPGMYYGTGLTCGYGLYSCGFGLGTTGWYW